MLESEGHLPSRGNQEPPHRQHFVGAGPRRACRGTLEGQHHGVECLRLYYLVEVGEESRAELQVGLLADLAPDGIDGGFVVTDVAPGKTPLLPEGLQVPAGEQNVG